MRKLIAIAAFAGLAACGSEKSGTIETDEGEAEYTVDTDSGETNIEFRGEDGETVNIRSGSQLAGNLPDGFSVYGGAEIVSSSEFKANDGAGMNVMMHSDASPQDMVDFYRKQAEAAGFSIETEIKTGEMMMIGGKRGEDGIFSFNASPGDDGTTGHLLVGDGLGN